MKQGSSIVVETVASPLRLLLGLLRLVFVVCAVVCGYVANTTDGIGRWQALVFFALACATTLILRQRVASAKNLTA